MRYDCLVSERCLLISSEGMRTAMDAKSGGFETFLQRLREQPNAPGVDTIRLLRTLHDTGPMSIAALVNLFGAGVIEVVDLLQRTGLVQFEDRDSTRTVSVTQEGAKVATSASVS